MNLYNLKNTFLWQLTEPGNQYNSYLLGSMHVKDARAFVMQHHFLELIQSVELYAAETNINDLKNNTDPFLMMLPAGTKLQDFYTKKQFLKISQITKKAFDIDLRFFQGFLPFFISSMIDESILSKDMPHSLDESLWLFAEQNDKMLEGIEPYYLQMSIMQRISLEDQAKQLLAIAKNVKSHRKNILKLASLYAEGNISKMHRSAKKGLGNLRYLLLWERNERMASRIYELVLQQKCFCTIGAGHLWGEKGVLKLLKDKGIRIQALPWHVD